MHVLCVLCVYAHELACQPCEPGRGSCTYIPGPGLRAKHQYQIILINASIAIQGGSSWNRAAKFNHIMFNVNSMKASAARIAETIVQQPAEHAVVVMAHNGPAGLGQQQHDICGRDWLEKAGRGID